MITLNKLPMFWKGSVPLGARIPDAWVSIAEGTVQSGDFRWRIIVRIPFLRHYMSVPIWEMDCVRTGWCRSALLLAGRTGALPRIYHRFEHVADFMGEPRVEHD